LNLATSCFSCSRWIFSMIFDMVFTSQKFVVEGPARMAEAEC
jgi:hypothetical protein